MKVLINAIDDNRYTENPNGIIVDDYELVNVQSTDTNDFFVFQRLYSKNEGSTGLEYYRILNTPNDLESVQNTPFIKVVDDLTNYLNIPKSNIHDRNEFIDNKNEDFLDFVNRAFFIKNPILLPDNYKKAIVIKRDDLFDTHKKGQGNIINPNFNYTIDFLNDSILSNTSYVIEPVENIFHGKNNTFYNNNISSIITENTNLYNGVTHYNLAFHNYGINKLSANTDYENIYYDFNNNTISYRMNDTYTIKMSDFKYFDKIVRRLPYVFNTAVEYISEPARYNLTTTAKPEYTDFTNMYYYTRFFDFTKTNNKISKSYLYFDLPSYERLTTTDYDNSILGNAIRNDLYSDNMVNMNLSGTIFTFNLEDNNKYLQLFISNVFSQNLFYNMEYTFKPSTVFAVRIIDNTYNKYITPYNLNLNVTTHLPYTDHYSRWHIQGITDYLNSTNYNLFGGRR